MSKNRFTVNIEDYVVAKARDAVVQTPGMTLSDLVTLAILEKVAQMERMRGCAFPPATTRVKRGRPIHLSVVPA